MGLVNPPTRKRKPNVPSAWKRIDTLLQKFAPDVHKDLGAPSKKRPLRELEKTIRRSLPKDAVDSLLCHNGQKNQAAGCIFGYRLLPVGEISGVWDMNRNRDDDAVPAERIRSFPSGAVQLCETHPGWIPLASDWNGNFIGVDLAPDLSGKRGQVIVFGRDEPEHFVLGSTCGEFLANYADDLKLGRFEIIAGNKEAESVEFEYCEGDGDVLLAIRASMVDK